MTHNKEDYLLTLYRLGADADLVGNKQVAAQMGITPASVTEMLVRMSAEGLLEYQPYKGSRLTEAGLQVLFPILRSHRLWEVFLIRHLGYSWSEAHEEAHELEHATSGKMLERLDAFLNYPTHCPHGEWIPREGTRAESVRLIPLSGLAAGQRAITRRVTEEKELLDYLQGIGMEIGAQIVIENVAPYAGDITLLLGERRISVSHTAAQQILVEQITQA